MSVQQELKLLSKRLIKKGYPPDLVTEEITHLRNHALDIIDEALADGQSEDEAHQLALDRINLDDFERSLDYQLKDVSIWSRHPVFTFVGFPIFSFALLIMSIPYLHVYGFRMIRYITGLQFYSEPLYHLIYVSSIGFNYAATYILPSAIVIGFWYVGKETNRRTLGPLLASMLVIFLNLFVKVAIFPPEIGEPYSGHILFRIIKPSVSNLLLNLQIYWIEIFLPFLTYIGLVIVDFLKRYIDSQRIHKKLEIS